MTPPTFINGTVNVRSRCGCAACALAPILAVVTVLVRISSARPSCFAQRPGLRGTPFVVVKFGP
jgi:lipopolysaccharide/colanic/teichoic acid biosynthesis glycosyltransferase